MSFYSPTLNVLNKSVRVSGKKIIRDFGEIEKLQSSVKETTKFVSIVKSNLNKDITEILKKLRPDLTIKSKNDNIKDCWILQILDGTTNFSRGIDNFFISISLKENGNIKICALYNPIKDENLCFQSGSGGYKNDYRIRVSETKRLNNSISSFYETKTQTDENIILGEIRQIMKKNNIETRESGSIMHEISLIACGKTDCLFFTELDKDINNQISLILSETGGIIDQLELKKKKIYMASNKYIGKIIKEMIENKYEDQ